MDANPHTPVDFRSPAALRVWCILAGLALAPMPILHALPSAFFYHLFESPPPGWVRITRNEAYWFTIMGLPLAPIFLAWSLPGASRPGLPLRSIVVLCLLVAYNPLRHYFEIHFYGDVVARMIAFDWAWIAAWIIRNLDTPLLIGLAATALIRRHTVRPLQKLLFHWGLFVCALWAAGHPYDSIFTEILLRRAFGI